MCQTAVLFKPQGKNAWEDVLETNCEAVLKFQPALKGWPAAVEAHSTISQEQLTNVGREQLNLSQEKKKFCNNPMYT